MGAFVIFSATREKEALRVLLATAQGVIDSELARFDTAVIRGAIEKSIATRKPVTVKTTTRQEREKYHAFLSAYCQTDDLLNGRYSRFFGFQNDGAWTVVLSEASE
jgi:hypothetical protein